MSAKRLDQLVRRLATARDGSGAEANVQADVRSLLLDGDLDLDAENLVDLAAKGRRTAALGEPRPAGRED